ncbi:hypothetical protein PJW08_01220 [Tenacibaculum finnmarkense]|nr:hypothetical protein PJW08_01220 [Tenacibaculum finnmarkense]
MLGLNIFRLIADLFTFILQPFKWLRLEVAKGDLGWWTSNAVNSGFYFNFNSVIWILGCHNHWVFEKTELKIKHNLQTYWEAKIN